MKQLLPKILFLAFIGLLVDLVVVFGYTQLTNVNEVKDDQAASLAVVFYTEDEQDMEQRLSLAMQLMTEKRVDTILTVGGMRPLENRIGAVDMGLELTMRGVPDALIQADETSNDTVSSIINANRFSKALGAESMIYVSNCMHLFRAVSMHKRLVKNASPPEKICNTRQNSFLVNWKRAHYEWFAWAVSLSPRSVREGLLRQVRP